MFSRSFGPARTLSALLLVGAAAACASSGASQSGEGLSPKLSKRDQTLAYWQQLRDSVTAQGIADEEGPRVSIRANFASFSGSRRVEAYFTLKDDAYILIGQLDGAGRLSVIFPESPDDDGFVRGGKTYRTPERFAGFDDQYYNRLAFNRAFYSSSAARLDSYDRGAGYLFVVASWRPMRFDRIADGARFTSYELNEFEINNDPRPAIGELAALIAGDNREAYSLEFAQYFRTNSILGGSSFASSFSNCYNSSYSYFRPFSAFYPYGSSFGYGNGGGCGYAPRNYYGYVPGPVGITPTPSTGTPRRPISPPGKPMAPPQSARPRIPLERNDGDGKSVQPVRPIISADAATARDGRGQRTYRDRGLLTFDDGGAERPRSASITSPRTFDQPSITDMVGRRRMDASHERSTESRYDRPRNAREYVGRQNDNPTTRTQRSPDAGMTRPREGARASREGERTNAPSSGPARREPSESRRIDGPRSESARPSAPAAAPRSEPTRTPAPAAERPTPRSEGASKPQPTANPKQ